MPAGARSPVRPGSVAPPTVSSNFEEVEIQGYFDGPRGTWHKSLTPEVRSELRSESDEWVDVPETGT
jgi:hypothetical protein